MNYGLFDYIISVLDTPRLCTTELAMMDRADNPVTIPPITETVEMQAAYEVKNFIDAIPGGFLIYHADGNEEIIYANKALLRIYGCSALDEFQELTGNSFKGMVHPEDLERVEKSITEQIAQSQYNLDYVEYRIRRKDGIICWVEDYGHFIHSETVGDIFYVFIADATEKKIRLHQSQHDLLETSFQREQHLQEQVDEYDKKLKIIYQEHLRRLEIIEGLSSYYDSILYINLDTNHITPYRMSNRLVNQFGQTDSVFEYTSFMKRYITVWVCEEDRDHIEKYTKPDFIRKTLASKEGYYINYKVHIEEEIQYLQLRIDCAGNREHISQIVMGCRIVDNEIRHEMEQKQMFEAAMKQARMANSAKNTFLANMSHDMRTPLNAIIGFAALAKNYINDSEKVGEYIAKIETSSNQLLHLINDILEISRIESGEIRIENSECSLSDIIHTVYSSMHSKAEAKNITLTIDDTGLRHRDIYSDYQKLTTILSCLISNAIKYTGKDGKIRIIAKELSESAYDSSTYQLIIEDNGMGIAKNHLKKIFEPFERVANTTLSGIHGTGLGLTIVKNLVELLGGTLEVDSTLGKGSRFTITLCLCHPQQQMTLEDAEALVIKMLNGRKILLVDDNEINLEIEVELLQQMGIRVDTAKNGSLAVEKLKNSEPDEYALVLMDIQMPVMDGYEATRTIRNFKTPTLAHIPIIALSANAFVEDRKMSRESGMNAHMAKPVDLPKLLELIAVIISKL